MFYNKVKKNLCEFSVTKNLLNSCKLASQREKLDAERKRVLKEKLIMMKLN